MVKRSWDNRIQLLVLNKALPTIARAPGASSKVAPNWPKTSSHDKLEKNQRHKAKLFWWRDFCFRRRLVRERQPSSGEKIALFFFLSVTHKIESCFKFEFEIRSVKWVSRFLGRKMTILTAEKEREGFFSVDNLFSVFQRDPRIATRRGVGRWGWETDPFEKFRDSKPMENKNSSCWWAVVVGSPHPARGTMSMRSG